MAMEDQDYQLLFVGVNNGGSTEDAALGRSDAQE